VCDGCPESGREDNDVPLSASAPTSPEGIDVDVGLVTE